MENPCRELRQLLGVNQVEFSRLIGRSYQSLKVYEKHPEDTPPEVIERIINLATARGHADWALVLKSDDWRIVSVIQPGETLISAPRPNARSESKNARWHDMLEDILESGNKDACHAVQSNLIVFHDYIGGRAKSVPPSKSGIGKKRLSG